MKVIAAGNVVINENIFHLDPKIKQGGGLYFQLNASHVYEVAFSATNILILRSFLRQLCRNKNRDIYYLSIPCHRVSPYLINIS